MTRSASTRATALALLGLSAAGCDEGPTSPAGEYLDLRPVPEVIDLGITGSGPLRLVVQREGEWARFWEWYGGVLLNSEGQPPVVDFGRDMVLVVSAGERPGTGHDIEVESVRRTAHALVARVVYRSPPDGADCLLHDILTTPFSAVLLEASELPVLFEERRVERPCR